MKIKQKTKGKQKTKRKRKEKKRKSISIKNINLPIGFFVTAYDKQMNARECLGNTKLDIPLLRKYIQCISSPSEKIYYYSAITLYQNKTSHTGAEGHSVGFKNQ